MSRRAIRILLVDDHALFREGLNTLLASQPDLDVVGEAGDGEPLEGDGLAKCRRTPLVGLGTATISRLGISK